MKCEHCGAEFEVEERITKITKRRKIDSIVIDEKIQESLRFCSYDCQLQHQQYVCEHCHKNFTPKSLNQVFCSSECRILASNASKKKEPTDVLMCEVCGKEFEREKKPGRKPTVCSEECRKKKVKENLNKRAKPKLICEFCGGVFYGHTAKQRYCSVECRGKAQRSLKGTVKTCVYCGKEFEPKHKHQICCSFKCGSLQSATHRKKRIRVCLYCGEEYEARHDQMFCSKKCAGRYRSKNKECVYCGSEFKGKGKYCSDECRNKSKIKSRVCPVCGKEFYATGTRKMCSDECRRIRANKSIRQYSMGNFIPKKVVCKECGVEFWTEYGNKRRVFCSDECARKNHKRASKAVRRARKKGLGYESFDPLDVFKRDRWTCQMCGAKTPKTYRGTCDDRAPELDHIIPLALGGEHSMRNTQCLCRKCNGDKGATARGQLRIA